MSDASELPPWMRPQSDPNKRKNSKQATAQRTKARAARSSSPCSDEVFSSQNVPEKTADEESNSSSDGTCESDEENDSPPTDPRRFSAKKLRALEPCLKPADFRDGIDDLDADFARKKLIQQLRTWARDVRLQKSEVEAGVRRVYVAWHPDKEFRNADRKEFRNVVFQGVQAEIRRLMEERARREEKFCRKNAERAERKEEKEDRWLQEGTVVGAGVGAAMKTGEQADDDDDDSCPLLEDLEGVEAGTLPARSHFGLAVVGGGNKCVFFGGECTDASEKTVFHGDLVEMEVVEEKSQDSVMAKRLFDRKNALLFGRSSSASAKVGPTQRSACQLVHLGSPTTNNSEYDLALFGGEWTSVDQRRFKQFDDLWLWRSRSRAWQQLKDGEDSPGVSDSVEEGRLGGKTVGRKKATSEKTDANAPCARSGHRMVYSAKHQTLYLFGGFFEQKNGSCRYLNDFCSVSLKDVCGTDAGSGTAAEETNTAEAVQGPTVKWIRDRRKGVARPPARAGHCMFLDHSENDDRIFVFGGSQLLSNDALKKLSDLWVYSITDQVWTEIKSHLPTLKSCFNNQLGRSGVVYAGVVSPREEKKYAVFFGGVTDLGGKKGREQSVFHRDILVLDLDTHAFHLAEEAPQPVVVSKEADVLVFPEGRIGAQAWVVEEKLFVYGGETDDDRSLKDLWEFSFLTKKWRCVIEDAELAGSSEGGESDDETVAAALKRLSEARKNKKVNENVPACPPAVGAVGAARRAKATSAAETIAVGTSPTTPENKNSSSGTTDPPPTGSPAKKGGKKKVQFAPEVAGPAPPQTAKQASANPEQCKVLSLAEIDDPSGLSKKERAKWEKKQRSEVKQVKQQEKELKKIAKKDAKLAKQKGGKKKGDGEEVGEAEEEEGE